MISYTHVYEEENAVAFMNNRPATAICGFSPVGPAGKSVGRCPECDRVLAERMGLDPETHIERF